ncbi:DsbA family protein [Patescibacteria group bacterium]
MTEQKNNNNIQMGIIIALLVVIAVMGFFLGKNSAGNINTPTNTPAITGDYEDLSITIIDDVRCGEKCPTDAILEQLKLLPSVAGAEIVKKDFADSGVAEYLNENNVTTLPLIVFSTNNFDVSVDPVQMDQNGQPAPKVNTFLQALPTGEFTLAIGATFNPFEERSERGFLMLDKEKLQAIKDNSYIKGNSDSKITWIEYSDLECPYCAKLHNAGTSEDLEAKYSDDLNLVFNHFPLGFHANAQPGAEILECLAEQKGSDAFYTLMKKAFTDEKSTKSYLIEEAVALGASEDDLNECLSSGKYTDKVKAQMTKATSLFGITGTPGNVLINNETGEYEVIS